MPTRQKHFFFYSAKISTTLCNDKPIKLTAQYSSPLNITGFGKLFTGTVFSIVDFKRKYGSCRFAFKTQRLFTR